MAPIPAGFAQVNFRFGGAATRFPAEATLGLDVTAVTDPIATLAQDISDLWATLWNTTSFSSSSEYRGLLLKYGPDATGPSVEVADSSFGTGSSGASSQVAYLARKQTALGGRSGRGRMYLPGVTEAAIGSDGAIDSLVITNLNARFVTFLNGLVANNAVPVLLHSADAPVSTPTPIVSMVVDAFGATQRRRLRR